MIDTSNNAIRQMAYQLGDLLKQPENTDLKDAFLGYNAKNEGGWFNFEALSGTDLKWAKLAGKTPPLTALTPEQTARWYTLLQQCDNDLYNATGRVQTTVFLLAQSYLGSLDVWKE